MKHLVIKLFADNESGELLLPRSYFICEDLERITHLASHNFILPNENIKDLKKQEVKEEPTEAEEHPKEEVKKTSTRKQRAKKTSDA